MLSSTVKLVVSMVVVVPLTVRLLVIVAPAVDTLENSFFAPGQRTFCATKGICSMCVLLSAPAPFFISWPDTVAEFRATHILNSRPVIKPVESSEMCRFVPGLVCYSDSCIAINNHICCASILEWNIIITTKNQVISTKRNISSISIPT